MRQKNTDIVEGQDYHKQFQLSPDQRRISKDETAEHSQRDKKQGQSDFRVKKKINSFK
jgi:hypothetical protein